MPESLDDLPHKPDSPRFGLIQFYCYAGICVVAGVAMSLNDFSKMWSFPSTLGDQAMFWSRVVLFAELLVLSVRWVWATHNELDMWIDYLDNPFLKSEIYPAMFSLALVLGLFLAFPHKVRFITFFMTVYFLVDYWAQWLANDHFAIALRRTRAKNVSSKKTEVLQAMEHYWLGRPQLARITTMMFFSSMAFSLALAGAFQADQQRERFQVGAYALLIVNLFIGESWISWWRYQRNKAIKQAIGSEEEIQGADGSG